MRVSDPKITQLLPLGTAAFHILVALAEREQHGYSITKEVALSTGGAVKLGPGTLYRLLRLMLADGWIVEAQSAEDARRRTYRLSPLGRRIAQAEASRLESLVNLARSRRLLHA